MLSREILVLDRHNQTWKPLRRGNPENFPLILTILTSLPRKDFLRTIKTVYWREFNKTNCLRPISPLRYFWLSFRTFRRSLSTSRRRGNWKVYRWFRVGSVLFWPNERFFNFSWNFTAKNDWRHFTGAMPTDGRWTKITEIVKRLSEKKENDPKNNIFSRLLKCFFFFELFFAVWNRNFFRFSERAVFICKHRSIYSSLVVIIVLYHHLWWSVEFFTAPETGS